MANYDILIIDEWLGSPPTDAQLSFLFELVEKRSEVKTTIFCSQYNPKDWYVRLGENTNSESLLNRILSGLCKLDCGDFNMREYYSKSKMKI
jgi:DNA replication protein DnaC